MNVGASPRGCPIFRVGADRRVCPDDSAGAAACRAGLLRAGREAAREREEGAAARKIKKFISSSYPAYYAKELCRTLHLVGGQKNLVVSLQRRSKTEANNQLLIWQ